MADNYQRGDLLPVIWQATGGTGGVLNIVGYDVSLENMLHDVTGTRHGGYRARIAGLADVTGNVKAHFDLDVMPWVDPPTIRPGVSGVIGFYVSIQATGKYVQVPCIIEKLHLVSGVENALAYDFDVKLNILAGTFLLPS